jgi:hypothetical protein
LIKREQTIKHRISQRTGGRIQELEVAMSGNRVVVRGVAPCFYLKQLALQGVLDVLGSPGIARIELDIEVRSPSKSET